MYFHSIVRS